MFVTKGEETMNEATTIIGDGVKLEGKFSGSGNVSVRGEVMGSLKTNDDLIVEASAKIEADVEAKNITIAGAVHGNVLCHGQLRLLSSGKIFGDVSTAILSVETGAVIKGQCSTTGPDSAEATNNT